MGIRKDDVRDDKYEVTDILLLEFGRPFLQTQTNKNISCESVDIS